VEELDEHVVLDQRNDLGVAGDDGVENGNGGLLGKRW